MYFIKLAIITAIILALSVIIMSVRMLFLKNGRFVQTSIGKNKDMHKLKISCPRHEELARAKKRNCSGCC